MPVTTYLGMPPGPCGNSELDDLCGELYSLTGEKFYVRIHRSVAKRFLRKDLYVERVSLIKHIGNVEYQVFCCVTSKETAMAYLLGAVGQAEKLRKKGDLYGDSRES